MKTADLPALARHTLKVALADYAAQHGGKMERPRYVLVFSTRGQSHHEDCAIYGAPVQSFNEGDYGAQGTDAAIYAVRFFGGGWGLFVKTPEYRELDRDPAALAVALDGAQA